VHANSLQPPLNQRPWLEFLEKRSARLEGYKKLKGRGARRV
jgi:hypothetical protein